MRNNWSRWLIKKSCGEGSSPEVDEPEVWQLGASAIPWELGTIPYRQDIACRVHDITELTAFSCDARFD